MLAAGTLQVRCERTTESRAQRRTLACWWINGVQGEMRSFCLLPPTAEAVWGSEGHFLGMPFVTFSMYSHAGLASQTLCVQNCPAAS